MLERLVLSTQWQLVMLAAGRSCVNLGTDVMIRPSPNKGLGAFAQRDLARGALLGRYTGCYCSKDEYDERVLVLNRE